MVKRTIDTYTAEYGWLWLGFYGSANENGRPITNRQADELAKLPTLLYLAGAADGPGYHNFSHAKH